MTTVREILTSRRAVIFDLFHTLVSVNDAAPGLPMTSDILGVTREQWNEQLMERSRERLVGVWRDPREIIERLARAIDPTIADDVIDRATANRVRRFETALVNMDPAVGDALRRLKDRGLRLGLLSNAEASEITGWQRSPVAGLFESAVFSCDVGCAKPEPEIYRISLDQLGVTAREAVFVGDGACEELRGAREVGLATVMVTGMLQGLEPERFEERRRWADCTVAGVPDLV